MAIDIECHCGVFIDSNISIAISTFLHGLLLLAFSHVD
jgi:hypothetical protein